MDLSRILRLPWPPQFFIPGCYCCGAPPLGRVSHTASSINDCMHSLGGTSDAAGWIDNNSKYDPSGDTWSADTVLPVPWRHMASCAISGNIYVFAGEEDLPGAGSDAVANTTEFDGSTWTAKTDCPSPARSQSVAVALSGLGYLLAGVNDSGSRTRITDEYDPGGDSWTTKTQMPTPTRSDAAAFVLSSDGYIAGGDVSLNDLDKYSPDTWTSMTSAPAPTRGGGPVGNQLGSLGYISCGRSNVPANLRDHDEYSPDAWTGKTDAPTPARLNLAGSSVMSVAYICGGFDGTNRLADTDSYVSDAWTSRADMT